jgi:hypothetical protein
LSGQVLVAAETTLRSTTARFRWRMPASDLGDGGEPAEPLGSGAGSVDFRHGRVAMWSRFALPTPEPGPEPPQDGQPGAVQVVQVESVVDDGTLYTLQPQEPADAGAPDTWTAIEMGTEGLAATPIGMVAWLRGVTSASRISASPGAPWPERIEATLALGLAVRRAPESERSYLYAGLEGGRVGLSEAVVRSEIALDDTGRVSWMRVSVPPGASPWFSVAYGEETLELELYAYDSPLAIPVPDAEMRVTAADFLASVEIQERLDR